MTLRALGEIDLPDHAGPGGFDHAAIHQGHGLLYVAHTANDAVDVIDTRSGNYLHSIPDLKGVAGTLVHEPQDLVFTSNRGENSVGVFTSGSPDAVAKIPVGMRPNGLAYDPARGVLLCGNVGEPDAPGSWSASVVDARARTLMASVPLPGRPRWMVFDPAQEAYFVNIAAPSCIVAIRADAPGMIARRFAVPERGPHGLDLDRKRGRLYCACDSGHLVALDPRSGEVLDHLPLSGPPDVIFLSESRARLYVAIGDPGVVDVIDIAAWKRIELAVTGPGAHTTAWDEGAGRLYVFLPGTHRASVFHDEC